jgi:hypothetical protein
MLSKFRIMGNWRANVGGVVGGGVGDGADNETLLSTISGLGGSVVI